MHLPTSWTFHIVTLGCKINQYESQAVREAWQSQGGREVPLETVPDVFLVNSCAITARGERDTRHALYRLARAQKAVQRHVQFRIVTGCAAHLVDKYLQSTQKTSKQNSSAQDSIAQHSLEQHSFGQTESYFDMLIPPKAKALLLQGPHTLIAMEEGALPQTHNPFGEAHTPGFSINTFHRTRPVLKVQDGCSHRCTYCIVPLVRGKSISRPAGQIIEEAQRLLASGHREIMLSGINLHQFGRDLDGKDGVKDFWDTVALLEQHLAPQWQGRARFRISSLEPSQLNAKGLDTLRASSLLCPHIHLSLQHGSAKVLKNMGRGHYKPEILTQAIQELRTHWPTLGLGADILMGFAGEKESDVQETLHCIESLGLTYAHVFPYSVRPGTAAAQFTEQVPHAEKLARAARVRTQIELQKEAFLCHLLQEKSLAVVFDNTEEREENNLVNYKGVEAHYASCTLRLTKGSAPKIGQGIMQVAPIGVENGQIICTPF